MAHHFGKVADPCSRLYEMLKKNTPKSLVAVGSSKPMALVQWAISTEWNPLAIVNLKLDTLRVTRFLKELMQMVSFMRQSIETWSNIVMSVFSKIKDG